MDDLFEDGFLGNIHGYIFMYWEHECITVSCFKRMLIFMYFVSRLCQYELAKQCANYLKVATSELVIIDWFWCHEPLTAYTPLDQVLFKVSQIIEVIQFPLTKWCPLFFRLIFDWQLAFKISCLWLVHFFDWQLIDTWQPKLKPNWSITFLIDTIVDK
jgi:hypothetical protein